MRKLLLLAAAALAGNWYAARQRKRRSQRLEPKASAEPLGRWENEGGGVPVGGSHTASQVRADDAHLPGEGGVAAQVESPAR